MEGFQSFTSLKFKKIGKYQLQEKIGHGSFAEVYTATYNDETVAIKAINKKMVDKSSRIKQEIEALSTLRHPNILRAYDIIEEGDYVYVVTQYLAGGDLLELMMNRGILREKTARDIFYQIVDAVEYASKNRWCHRDIKLENVLLTNQRRKHRTAVLADWGFSTKFSAEDSLIDSVGTLSYAAPEIISGQNYRGPEVDVWSLGVLLYILVSAHLPFTKPGEDEKFERKRISKGDYYPLPSKCSTSLQKLISSMLTVDRTKRITLQEIKKHPWMRSTNRGNTLGNMITKVRRTSAELFHHHM